jgi:Tfp pilus assembly protein FimT
MSDKVMSGVSYAGAGVSVASGLTLTEWGIVVGIVTALLTFAANLFYQYRKDRREQRLHDLEVQYVYKARREAQEEQDALAEGAQQ